MKKKWIKIDLFIALTMSIITILYAGFYAQFHFDPHHDGILLKPAIDVYMGKRLFSESFTQYGALTTLIHVVFMKIFGPTILSLRYSAVVFYGFIAFLLFFIWRVFLSRKIALVGICIWIVTAYFPNQDLMVPFLGWSSVYSLAFQLLTVWLLLQYLESKKRFFLLFGGFSVALTFWSRQPVGIFLFGALALFLIFRAFLEKKIVRGLVEMAYFSLGGMAASSIFFIWLAKTNSLTEWYEQSIRLAFNFGSRLSNSFSFVPVLRDLFPSILEQKKDIWWNLLPIAAILTVFVYAVIVIATKRKTKTKHWQILLLGIVSLASWLQYFPVGDHSHFSWAAAPMIGLFLLIVPQILYFLMRHGAHDLHIKMNEQRWVHGLVFVVTLAVLSPFIVTSVRGMKIYTRRSFVILASPPSVKGTRVTIQEATVIKNVQDRLATYFSLYPNKYGLNLTPDAFYSLIDPHMKQFHVSPVYWDWASETIWADYVPEARYLVRRDRPLAMTRDFVFGKNQDNVEFRNYCQIDLRTLEIIRMQIYMRPLIVRVPIEDLVAIKELDGKLSITPIFNDIRVVHVVSDDQEIPVAVPLGSVGSYGLSVGKKKQDHTLEITLSSKTFGSCVYTEGKIKQRQQTTSQIF